MAMRNKDYDNENYNDAHYDYDDANNDYDAGITDSVDDATANPYVQGRPAGRRV